MENYPYNWARKRYSKSSLPGEVNLTGDEESFPYST